MKKKLFYVAPYAELIELKLDDVVMQGSLTPGDSGSDPIEDEGDMN